MFAFQTAGGGHVHLRRQRIGQLSEGRVSVGFIFKRRAAEDIDELILLGVKITQPRQPVQATVRAAEAHHRLHVHLFAADVGVRQLISRGTVNVEIGIDNAVFQRQAIGGLPGQIPDTAVHIAFEHRPADVVTRTRRMRLRVEAFRSAARSCRSG